MGTQKGQGASVLYLDYDGALHHENCWMDPKRGPYLQAPERYVLFQHVDLLLELLAPYPSVRIVLSTSWVRRFGIAGTTKWLPASLRERVIGATYLSRRAREGSAPVTRGEQVTQDVLRRRPANWFAIDDDQIGWPEWARPRVVFSDPYEGISPPEVQDAIRRQLSAMAQKTGTQA